MLKKKSFYVVTLLLGICLISISLLFRDEEFIKITGVCIGVGAGLFGMSIANLYGKRMEQKNPQLKKQNEINSRDERNIIILNKAKAKAAEITQFFIIGVAYITILIGTPLWVTLVTIGVYLLYHILGMYFISKFNKEM